MTFRLVAFVILLSLFLSCLGLRAATEPQPPSTALQSLRFADPGLVAELAAAEPEVISPVAIAWDAAGRMFVAEMRDYPNATNGGAIRLLTDRDNDGRYESSAIYADGLSYPNSVLPWNGGVLVTSAPDLLFLKDTDADDRADERRVLFSGFGAGNQQLRANGLTWGPDGWVYGANGRSDGAIRRAGPTNAVPLRGRDFRFRPDTGEFETLPGRSQFGLALDDWGDRFLSWNTIPIRHEVFPDRYLTRHPALAGVDVLADLLPREDGGAVYPLTPPPLVFNSESSSHFNALAGLMIYRGTGLGGGYYGSAFVGESLRNLVHRRVLEPAGATFTARRREANTEFLRSTDPWFHPVNFATGPDGALYVVDFYRQFVEHPDFVPRDMREKVSWQTGSEHGRIWRVRAKSAAGPSTAPRSHQSLAVISASDLVPLLLHSNAWRRETAHRLLWERKDPAMAGALRDVVRLGERETGPERGFDPRNAGRALALELLFQLGALDDAVLTGIHSNSPPVLRARAVRLAAALLASGRNSLALGNYIADAATDPDPRGRLAAALALRDVRDDALRDETLRTRLAAETDRWVRLALAGSSRTLTGDALATVLPRSIPSLRPPPVPASPDPDRQKVFEQFRPALQLTGDRAKGARTFASLCLPCHYLQGQGVRVGPDLSGIATRPPEALLTDLLDPSRQIAPEYQAYEATLTDGESVVGLFASETETRITLRLPGAPDENLPRSRVKSMRATGKSLMPDGLEAGLTLSDVADLIAFLRNPDASLLPERGGSPVAPGIR